MTLKGAPTKFVDLGGRPLLPSFIDPHGHASLAVTQGLLPQDVKQETVLRLLCMTRIGEAGALDVASRPRPPLQVEGRSGSPAKVT